MKPEDVPKLLEFLYNVSKLNSEGGDVVVRIVIEVGDDTSGVKVPSNRVDDILGHVAALLAHDFKEDEGFTDQMPPEIRARLGVDKNKVN